MAGYTVNACPKDCIYLQNVHGEIMCCSYILNTSKMRGCDPGPGCKRYVGMRKRPNRRKPGWDTATGKRMWLEGKSDREIADALGVRRDTVGEYRRRVWRHEDG